MRSNVMLGDFTWWRLPKKVSYNETRSGGKAAPSALLEVIDDMKFDLIRMLTQFATGNSALPSNIVVICHD